MTMSQVSGKRKYFSRSKEGTTTPLRKVFLLRYCDKETEAIHSDEPYADEKLALRALTEYLKKGICSWVVTYNG